MVSGIVWNLQTESNGADFALPQLANDARARRGQAVKWRMLRLASQSEWRLNPMALVGT
jgi:hypothetical protein